eukprot:TRINITY_DN23780_c0_g1_i3.p2 TRINITY_DN23780_c0_g1~~TRINITY_DN23780_c0_g1_i3.p2  ORF type:complete len:115 (-),score=21.21 TRINITY_DN23780_c0_g1_i3:127-471(-)
MELRKVKEDLVVFKKNASMVDYQINEILSNPSSRKHHKCNSIGDNRKKSHFHKKDSALLVGAKYGVCALASAALSIALSSCIKDANKSGLNIYCLLYTSPSPRDLSTSRMPSSA